MISEEEAGILAEFKCRVQNISFDWYDGHDLSLLKWLRARNLDVEQAEKMLRKSLDWRKTNGIDNILDHKFPQDLTEELPFQISGADSDGCLVVVVPFGRWDFRKFAEKGKHQLVLNYIDFLFETLMAVLKVRSSPTHMITQGIVVLDYEGFGLRQITSKQNIEMLLQILSRIEANRPEVLKRGFIVNAPRIFEMAYKLYKPLISARTLSKLFIHGPNATEWKKSLLHFIPPHALPSFYGGSNSSCLNYKFSDGQRIASHCHEEFGDDQMSMKIIKAGESFKVAVTIDKGKVLRWSFKTENNDIGFRLLNDFGECLVSCPRADAHIFKQNGTFHCRSSGTYILNFDNTYSHFAPKTLMYALSVGEDTEAFTITVT